MLAWGLDRCLENSLIDYLQAQVTADGVTDLNSVAIPVRAGDRWDNNWTLPCIAVHVDSTTIDSPFIGENYIDDRQLIIINIYATNDGERKDISNWMVTKLKDGWRYYTYVPNPSNPSSPTKTAGSLVIVDSFLSSSKVQLGDDVSEIDAHRHQISINVLVPNA